MSKKRFHIISILVSLCFVMPAWAENGGCVFDVSQYGAYGNDPIDDTLAIESAINAAENAVLNLQENVTLIFPAANGYLVERTLNIPKGVHVIMNGPVIWNGNSQSVVMNIGEDGTNNNNLELKLQVINGGNVDWSSEDFVGIRLINTGTSRIEIIKAEGFTIGVQCLGSGGGFVHNDVWLGWLINNKIGIDLNNRQSHSGSGAYGTCNENSFYNGRFGTWTNLNRTQSRYGVRITTMDQYESNNNNLFIKPSFEIGNGLSENAEAVAILIEHGLMNRFDSCRDESGYPVVARILNNSAENEIHFGYGGYAKKIEDFSTKPTTYSTNRRTKLHESATVPLYKTGPLHLLAGNVDQDKVHIPGLHVVNYYDENGEVRKADNRITIDANYLEVDGLRGIGGFIRTEKLKRFVLRREFEEDFPGRLNIRCYDENGLVLKGLIKKINPATGEEEIDPQTGETLMVENPDGPFVTGTHFAGFYYSKNGFGGRYIQGSDGGSDLFFQVNDKVKRIAVFLTGGTNKARLRSFSLYSVDGGEAAWETGYTQPIKGVNLAQTPPDSGIWEKGRMVYNSDPDPGEALGWICVESSSQANPFGVWKSFGSISN